MDPYMQLALFYLALVAPIVVIAVRGLRAHGGRLRAYAADAAARRPQASPNAPPPAGTAS